ncbi:hypothetical protein M501DRAFT_934971, partial [Patellaria atrata CBS 101060]
VFFPLAMSLTKISLCIGYLRLFPSRANKIFNYVAIIYLSGWGISTLFTTVFSCVTITNKCCINLRVMLITTAALNKLTDFLIFLWPCRTLWKVQLSPKQRIGLVLTFACGSIIYVAGIMRMWYFEVYLESPDPYYESAILWPITVTEVITGIICANLPSTRPLLAKLIPSIFARPRLRGPGTPMLLLLTPSGSRIPLLVVVVGRSGHRWCLL